MVHYRLADVQEMVAIRNFHVANHMEETVRCPGEKEQQEIDLKTDFPHLYDEEEFKKSWTFVATKSQEGSEVVGTISLNPDKVQSNTLWIQVFSVAAGQRKQGIGAALLDIAIIAARMEHAERVRVVTLDNYTGGYDMMGPARRLYEQKGFTRYEQTTVTMGFTTFIDLVYMEKYL